MSGNKTIKFTNNAGIETQITLLKSEKLLLIREDYGSKDTSVTLLNRKTALDVANWIINNMEVVGNEEK